MEIKLNNNLKTNILTNNSDKIDKSLVKKQLENKKTSSAKSGYSVSLSSESKSMNEMAKNAFKIAKEAPDVRESKVNKLKEMIKNGSYKVDSSKIADGILREEMKDHFALTM